MRFRLLIVLALVAGIVGLIPHASEARARTLGRLDPIRPHVWWTGKLVAATNPMDCLPVTPDPLCDHGFVDIHAQGQSVEVTLVPDNPSDQISIYAFRGRKKVGAGGSLNSTERFVIESPPDGLYDLRVHPLLAPNGARYRVDVKLVPSGAPDLDPPPCEPTAAVVALDAVALPGGTGVPGTPVIADDGHNVDLDILVLLDGVTEASAAQTLAKLAVPYAPLHITARAVRYEPFSVATFESADIIQAARVSLGGQRPPDADLVLVITTKDITSLGLNAVAGQADCIGGLADPKRAFMVAEAAGDGEALVPDFAAKVTAHEMGHLLGGQHHLANCLQGLDPADPFAFTPCTLMFNDVSLLTMKFSAVNSLIVRGYALKYASVND